MSSFAFRIELPDGSAQLLTLPEGRVIVGSGAHCDVRLPANDAKPEHLVLDLGPTTMHAQVLSFEPPPLLNGASFGESALARESMISIGSVRVHVTRSEVAAPLIQSKQKKTNPLLLLLGAASILFSAYIVLKDSLLAQPLPRPTADKPPELWTAPPQRCPQSDPQEATAIGNERLALAVSKRERRPFSAQDGVAAVPLFEVAAVCLRGTAPGSSRSASEAATKLRDDIQMDYRTHQVRLEHALSVKDYPTADREVVLLLALTEGKTGPYVAWLAALHRRLRLKPNKK